MLSGRSVREPFAKVVVFVSCNELNFTLAGCFQISWEALVALRYSEVDEIEGP